MEWVQKRTFALPHSVVIAGWWSASSASMPTRLVKASAAAKSANSKVRDSCSMPSMTTIFQPGISARRPVASSFWTVGLPGRQAWHGSRASDSLIVVSS